MSSNSFRTVTRHHSNYQRADHRRKNSIKSQVIAQTAPMTIASPEIGSTRSVVVKSPSSFTG